MIKYQKCEACKEYHWSDAECDPKYLVYHEEQMGDDPKEIRASGYENAALKYAEYYNTRNDYALMNDSIDVKVEKDGVIKYYRVGAEPDIYYSSKEIDSI